MKQEFSKEFLKRLSEDDFKEIVSCRGKHNKLGFAYQMFFVKINNYFPKQKLFEIAEDILDLASFKLDIEPSLIVEYQEHRQHISRHQIQIKAYLKLESFNKKENDQLCDFLLETSKQIEQTNILYLKANQYLREKNILKPSDNTIYRIIGTQKEKARHFIFSKIRSLLSDNIIENLENLINVQKGYSLNLVFVIDYIKKPRNIYLEAIPKNSIYTIYIIDQSQTEKIEILDPKLDKLLEKHQQQNKGILDITAEAAISELILRKQQLTSEVNESFSGLYKIKRPVGNPSSNSMLSLAGKLSTIKETGALDIDLKWINNNYQKILTKYCKQCSAHRLKKLEANHRYTVLLCFLQQIYQDSIDHMVDMHSKLTNKIYNGAETELNQHLQKKKKIIKTTLTTFQNLSEAILDESIADKDLRKELFTITPREELENKVNTAKELFSGKYSDKFNLVTKKFSYLRQFFPVFLEHIEFQSENTNSSVIEAVDLLKDMNRNNKRKLPDSNVPIEFIPKRILPFVQNEGKIDKAGWECALMAKIDKEIRRGNISVASSKRFNEFEKFFTPRSDWNLKRDHFFKRAKLPVSNPEIKSYLRTKINKAYDDFFEQEATNKYATVENEKWVLSVDPAEQLSSSDKRDLKKLKSWLSENVRTIKLPELLIEVDNDLHFTENFLPSGKTNRSTEDVCMVIAAIMALGCNIGAYTMAKLTNNMSTTR